VEMKSKPAYFPITVKVLHKVNQYNTFEQNQIKILIPRLMICCHDQME